jgi:hypothetical protein
MTNATEATITADEVQSFRRSIYSKAIVSREDLTNLLELGRKAEVATPAEFGALLADVAADLLVNQVDPPRYIKSADAEWLVSQLQSRGGLSLGAEFTMLMAVLRLAVSIPPALSSFAVSEIERAIVQGHRAALGTDHAIGIVTHDDVESLRTAVFAAAEGSSVHVSRESAETLFRIAHATSQAGNDPEFNDLFAKAIGNYLMGIAFHWTPSVADELEKEKWMDRPTPAFGSFMEGLVHLRKTEPQKASEIEANRIKAENDADQIEISRKADITQEESDWLLANLTRSGDLTEPEKTLLRFLKENARSLPPKLLETINLAA